MSKNNILSMLKRAHGWAKFIFYFISIIPLNKYNNFDKLIIYILRIILEIIIKFRNTCLVWGIPYLIPTPTRGNALMTFFTVNWSWKANRIEAETHKKSVSLQLIQNFFYHKNSSLGTKPFWQFFIFII